MTSAGCSYRDRGERDMPEAMLPADVVEACSDRGRSGNCARTHRARRELRRGRALRTPVGFQNAGMALGQRFQAAISYSLRRPPRIGRRRILPRTSSGTGDVGRGGRNCMPDAGARCCSGVGDLGPRRQDEALGEAVRPRTPRRDLTTRYPCPPGPHRTTPRTGQADRGRGTETE